MRYSKSEIIKMATIGAAAGFLVVWLYYGVPLWLCFVITAAVEVFLFVSLRFEKKSDEQYKGIGKSIKDGDYHKSDEWREKYAEFVNHRGFAKVKRRSMKADLTVRYLRPFGIFMACLGAACVVLGVLAMADDTGAGVVTILTGGGFAAYGAYAVFPKNVRSFIKQCGDELTEINDSYMSGGILAYKRNATGDSWNDGINIGDRYVVMFTRKKISAVEKAEVVSVKQNIHRIKYYGDGLYTGSEYAYNTDIYTCDGKVYRIRLSEFQSELVCETLTGFASDIDRVTNESVQEYNV